MLWSGADRVATQAVHTAHVDRSNNGTNDHWEATVYTVTGDETVATETVTVENFGGCDDVNWPCVTEIAATYAAMFGSCAMCSASLTPPTCAVCLSAVGWHLAAQHCPWCND